MASSIRIELNRPGVGHLLKGPEIQADLARRAAAIAAAAGAAGGTFGHNVRVSGSRARAIVFTEDFLAMEDEATDRALTRAIDAGRG